MSADPVQRPAGIPGSALTGPWPVGQYAAALREQLRGFARVQVFGEAFGVKAGRAKVWFELRDGAGALPCSMWRRDWDALELGPIEDGTQVVAAGGCDYYAGSHTSSPSFSFAVTDLRVAGEGDLMAQLARLRATLAQAGLFEPQTRLPRPALPRCIGVVTGEGGKARDDVLAGLRRRGWSGRVVWAFAPVQDRHAAPAITRALQDLASCQEVEVVIVARGGGSLADLFAFCDETLCRTVAMLRVPVIASVGHHTDRTLIDDVAAVSCSTPTHAAEAAVPVHCGEARERLHAWAERLEAQGRRAGLESERLGGHAARLSAQGRRAVLERARLLARLARAPAEHVDRHVTRLHQHLRELRASARRGVERRHDDTSTRLRVVARKAAAAELARSRGVGRARGDAAALERTAAAALARRARDVDRLALALAAHDPQRTLERGYALVEDADGEPVTSAAAAAQRPALGLRFADGRVRVRPERSLPSPDR